MRRLRRGRSSLPEEKAVEQKGENEQDLSNQGAPEVGKRRKHVLRRSEAGCIQQTSTAHWKLGLPGQELWTDLHQSKLSKFLAVLGGCWDLWPLGLHDGKDLRSPDSLQSCIPMWTMSRNERRHASCSGHSCSPSFLFDFSTSMLCGRFTRGKWNPLGERANSCKELSRKSPLN